MNPYPIYMLDDGLLYYLKEGRFYLYNINNALSASSGASGASGGGGGGISGLTIDDHNVPLPGKYKELDFEGTGVTVVNSGNKKATITINGYVIASLTTAQRLALIPTTALIVEDIDLDMYFKWSTVDNAWSPF